jgi:hypothetical protein
MSDLSLAVSSFEILRPSHSVMTSPLGGAAKRGLDKLMFAYFDACPHGLAS